MNDNRQADGMNATTTTGQGGKPPFPTLAGSPSAQSLLHRVDFAGARLVSGRAGVGRKSAPAYIETTDPDEFFKDTRASVRSKNLTRKLAIFERPDGSIHIGSAFVNTGKGNRLEQFVSTLDDTGKVRRVPFAGLVNWGWKPLGAVKTRDAQQKQVSAFSVEEWLWLQSELRAAMEAAKRTAEAMLENIGGVTMPDESASPELPARKAPCGRPPELVSDEDVKRLSKLVEVPKLSLAIGIVLWNEIGAGEIDVDSALVTLEVLLADPADEPRAAALSLICYLEDRFPYQPKEDIIEAAAGMLSRASRQAVDGHEFARRLISESGVKLGRSKVWKITTAETGLKHASTGYAHVFAIRQMIAEHLAETRRVEAESSDESDDE